MSETRGSIDGELKGVPVGVNYFEVGRQERPVLQTSNSGFTVRTIDPAEIVPSRIFGSYSTEGIFTAAEIHKMYIE
jgi:hypothetical protein